LSSGPGKDDFFIDKCLENQRRLGSTVILPSMTLN
jgi:hypothetical protein